MDDLGDRVGSNTIRNGATSSSVTYVLDTSTHDDTNRYATIDSNSLSYDAAGNLTADHRGYSYVYDYENRITRIYEDVNTDGDYDSGTDTSIAEYDYDALSRRIRMVDNIASATTLYYYNDNWQVLQEYNSAGTTAQRYFIYGNYIDEVLIMNDGTDDYYYAHDHLYSPVALMEADGDVIERYEYDAYGRATVFTVMGNWDTGSPTTQGYSAYGNPYMFTGRRLDLLDDGDYDVMYYRNRYYDTETGRFLTHDPLGVNPSGGKDNYFNCTKQYKDGMNIYQYVNSNPIIYYDPIGLDTPGCSIPGGHWGNKCWLDCCNTHDKCYADKGCTARSWCGRKNPDCIKCNDEVSWCFLTNIICFKW